MNASIRVITVICTIIMDLGTKSVHSGLNVFIHLITFWIHNSRATSEISNAELQYLSNHLSDEECSRLSSALYVQTFRLSNKQHPPLGVDNTRGEITTCFEHLIRWNSSPEGGRAKTQAEMAHRLIQVGRPDLANWLTATVFKVIANELLEALQMQECATAPEVNPVCAALTPDVEVPFERLPWRIHDTLLIVASCLVLLYLIAISCKALKKAYSYKRWARIKTHSKPTLLE